MRLLIIDQCSGSKDHPESSPVFDAEAIDSNSKAALLDREDVPALPARSLYTGRQQAYIDAAQGLLEAAGHCVTRYYVSAGFGVVADKEALPPYEVTFSEMTVSELDARAEQLRIQEDILELVENTNYDIIFFPLSVDYYQTLDLELILESVDESTDVVLFNQEELAERYETARSIPARTDEAKDQGTIVIALKGHYIRQFAEACREHGPPNQSKDIVAYCDADPDTEQAVLDEFELSE